MYAGKVVDYTDVVTMVKEPKHPYTMGRLKFVPRPDKDIGRPDAIPGFVPGPLTFSKGCKVDTRGRLADTQCSIEEPEIEEIRPAFYVRCRYADTILEGQESRNIS
jgi:oligopeptide/dipeptide ABC transporter ATP-binding protein